MYYFQVSDNNQQILEEQLRKSQQNGYDLWYKNSSNPNNNINANQINNANNQANFSNNNNINSNQNPQTFNMNQNQQMSQSSLSLNNNFRSSVQQINDEGAVNCNRCQRAPIDYISLNCGHNFCLECMAISVLKGEGRVIQSQYSDNQPISLINGFENSEEQANCGQIDNIEMTCYSCGQESELGYQSRSAIYIFIQMIIQKYEQKQQLISSQQSDNLLLQQQMNNHANSSQTSASAAFGTQLNHNNQINTFAAIQMNTSQNQIHPDNSQILGAINNINIKQTSSQNATPTNMPLNSVNGGNINASVNMQNNQINTNLNGNQISNQLNSILTSQRQQDLNLQQTGNQQHQLLSQHQNGDEVIQYYQSNSAQYESNNPRSARIQKDDVIEKEDGFFITTNTTNNNINASNRVSNYTTNQNALRGSEEDLIQYESLEQNIIQPQDQQGLSVNNQQDQLQYQQIQQQLLQQYQLQQQQQQLLQSRNRLISPISNENASTSNNLTVNSQIAQQKLAYDNNQQNNLQQQQILNQPNNTNYDTPYIKQQQQQIIGNINNNNMLSTDKIRASMHEQAAAAEINQQQLQIQQSMQNGQNANFDKQILLQQQENLNTSSQNNLVSTPNYSMLTEKKPTQPQYSQMIPTNNQTPQNTSNITKKSPHLSKSTHIMSNNNPNSNNNMNGLNHSPFLQGGGKTFYNQNVAQSQQFQQDSNSLYQQFLINQQQLQSGGSGTKNNLISQIDENSTISLQHFNDHRNTHPKLSAFSASNTKNQGKQNQNYSHLQPFGNSEEMTSMFEAQISHSQKHALPYRQQSQLETGIIEQCDNNKLLNENGQGYENGASINLKQNNLQEILQTTPQQQSQQQLQQLQQQQQVNGQNIQKLQQMSRIQLQQVDEIRESNSAMNSIIGNQGSAAQINCVEHPFNELTLYCFSCDNKLLCIKCLQNGEHRDHDVQSISKNFEYLLGKMNETSHEINASIELLTIHEKRLQDKRKEYLRQIKIIKEQIQDNLNDVKVSLVNKEQHLLQQAEQIFTEKEGEIQQEIHSIQNKTQAISQVKNQFELICESYFKNKTNLQTEREDESMQTHLNTQYQLSQQQEQTQKEMLIQHIDDMHNHQIGAMHQQQQQQINQISQQKQTNLYPQVTDHSQHISQQKNIQSKFESIEQQSSSDDLHEHFKSFSEMDKLSHFRFYSECKSVLCSLGITRNAQMNEKLNNTINQQHQQQYQSPPQVSYHLTPHQAQLHHLNETPRSQNNALSQLQNISQIHQSGLASNYQSNQPTTYYQQHQISHNNTYYNNNNQQQKQGIESQYASVRSNISNQYAEEEEQFYIQQQQQMLQQNQQQYNLMSSQDLSQLIDDVQKIKKEAILIDLHNYNQKLNTTLNNSALNQRESKYQQSQNVPLRGNQLFHEYLNQQRSQHQPSHQSQQQQAMKYIQEVQSSANGKEQVDDLHQYLSNRAHNMNNHNSSTQQSNQKINSQNQTHNTYFQTEGDQQLKERQKINDQPISSYSEYLAMQQNQDNANHASYQAYSTNINNYSNYMNANQNNGLNNNNKMSSSYLNQSNSQAVPTQTSETDLVRRDLTKNSSYIKQKKSKWLDEETLEQDQEYFHHYHPYQQQQNQPVSEGLGSAERIDKGNYKQKQEFNKHLDNIFKKNGNNSSSNSNNNNNNNNNFAASQLLNKIQSNNSFDYLRSNKVVSNSTFTTGGNGYQTERLNTNQDNIYNNKSYTNTAASKQSLEFNIQKFGESPKTIPFSPSFKNQNALLRGPNSYTTRPSNQNTSMTRQSTTVKSHLKVNASLSTHNTSSQAQKNLQQPTAQSFLKNTTNQSLNQRSIKVKPNQSNTYRERSNNIESLFETLRTQKEQFNQKKKQHFLVDQ